MPRPRRGVALLHQRLRRNAAGSMRAPSLAGAHLSLLVGGARAFAPPVRGGRPAHWGRACYASAAPVSVAPDAAGAAKPIPAGTTVLADDARFVKSLPETRAYRAVELPNKLTVLLASDPTADAEAAAVHVRAGHFDDPADRAGLAHFHEHMLFLGTEKYPAEDAYADYLGAHGGASNAYTDMEDTNYYFHVSATEATAGADTAAGGEEGGALAGALDRLAQFFVAPRFDPSMLERELRAVDSEYRNGRTADGWRQFQLLKRGADPAHPFAKFGCGNYKTLTDGGDADRGRAAGGDGDGAADGSLEFGGGSSPRDALVRFWTDKYHAGNLRLCVVGRASLDELQATVERTFGPVRPPPPAFVANGLVARRAAGALSPDEDAAGDADEDAAGAVTFRTEHATYAPHVAFGPAQLGLLREVVPLKEERTLKILSAAPPAGDPALRASRPFRVLSHLVGHESPGSLHHLLTREGWIHGLGAGTGLSASDFSLTSVNVRLTPKGMRERDQVLATTWQWLALIREAVTHDPHGAMERYHDELKALTETSFKYREMGDPADFCSAAAKRLFDHAPEKVLVAGAEVGAYDADVARAFLARMTPQNSLVVVTGPAAELEAGRSAASAHGVPWETEEWYGAQYRQRRVPAALLQEWHAPAALDPRLRLPGPNAFLPEDLSLRCDDPAHRAAVDPAAEYRTEIPALLVDTPRLRLWHKMDRTFRVPRTSIQLQLTTPEIYRSPRAITLGRLFRAVLSDDLNSYAYAASVAGLTYGVACVPSAFRVSVSGYSDKLPRLLDVVTGRVASLIAEMQEGAAARPALADMFRKAKDNLLRQTKNHVFESPYQTASYNLRMLLETPVWHVDDYAREMEGADADAEPLTMEECAEMAEQCLFGRSKAVSLCIGNIDEKGAREVAEVIATNFLKKRPLSEDENPQFRSLRMPSEAEALQINGSPTEARKVPIIYEAVAHSESEENNAVELFMQTASSTELGYEGLAIQELIGSMAYNSAFNQLRTKEQLGYIVSAFVKRSTGGGSGFSVLVQSSNTLPPVLEERCLSWVSQFRQEMEDLPEARFAMEAAALRVKLLEKDIKLAEEIRSVWGEILATVPHSEHFKNPVFDRVEKFADVLDLDGAASPRTAAELKRLVLAFYDKYFMSPERRAVSSRVYNRQAQDAFDRNVGTPGILSSYADTRKLKQHLASLPTAPYW